MEQRKTFIEVLNDSLIQLNILEDRLPNSDKAIKEAIERVKELINSNQ